MTPVKIKRTGEHARHPQATYRPAQVEFDGTFPFVAERNEKLERIIAGCRPWSKFWQQIKGAKPSTSLYSVSDSQPLMLPSSERQI